MTLLFKPKHVPHILREAWPWKTATRRLWKGKVRAKVGSFHWLSTAMLKKDKRFARAFISAVDIEPFQTTLHISESDVMAEGYLSRAAYVKSFTDINRRLPPNDEPVTVVGFIWVGNNSSKGHIQCPNCLAMQTEDDGVGFDPLIHFCQECGHSFSGEEPCRCHPHPKGEEP